MQQDVVQPPAQRPGSGQLGQQSAWAAHEGHNKLAASHGECRTHGGAPCCTLRWRASAAARSAAACCSRNASDAGSSSGLWHAFSRRSMRRTCARAPHLVSTLGLPAAPSSPAAP